MRFFICSFQFFFIQSAPEFPSNIPDPTLLNVYCPVISQQKQKWMNFLASCHQNINSALFYFLCSISLTAEAPSHQKPTSATATLLSATPPAHSPTVLSYGHVPMSHFSTPAPVHQAPLQHPGLTSYFGHRGSGLIKSSLPTTVFLLCFSSATTALVWTTVSTSAFTRWSWSLFLCSCSCFFSTCFLNFILKEPLYIECFTVSESFLQECLSLKQENAQNAQEPV